MRNRPLCFVLFSLFSAASAMRAQDAVRSATADQPEAEAEPVVVSATRTDIPLDQSPASVSVIDSQDIDAKQIERVSDALREVPGLNVVQTGTPGQLTSVFMRGLPSEDMQVLLDGIPINQGLAGQFDFANLTTDDVGRIEVARGPQSTIYGPRALAGVVQIFTKQGNGPPGITLSSEGGSYDTFRESLEATANSANSIIPSAPAGSTPTMRGQTTIIAAAPGSRTLAGRLTNNYGSEACLSIPSATREIPTQSPTQAG